MHRALDGLLSRCECECRRCVPCWSEEEDEVEGKKHSRRLVWGN